MSKTIIGNCVVSYHKEGGWTVQNGTLQAQFGTGGAAYRKAIRCAIEYQYPDVAEAVVRLARKHEGDDALINRAWRAAQLLIAGNVREPNPAGGPSCVATVISQDGRPYEKFYQVHERQGQRRPYLSCTCPDFINGSAPVVGGRSYCKHVISVTLLHLLGWQAAPDPPEEKAARRAAKKMAFLHFADGSDVPDHAVDIHADHVTRVGRQAQDEQALIAWYRGEKVS